MSLNAVSFVGLLVSKLPSLHPPRPITKTRRDGRELTMFAQDKEAQKRERKPTTKRTFGGAGLRITSPDAGSEGVFDHRPLLVQDKSIGPSSPCTSLLRQQSSEVAKSVCQAQPLDLPHE